MDEPKEFAIVIRSVKHHLPMIARLKRLQKQR